MVSKSSGTLKLGTPLVFFAVEESRAPIGGILEQQQAFLLLSPIRYDPSADCDQCLVQWGIAGLLQEMYKC